MKLDSNQLQELISRVASESSQDIDIDGEIEAFKDYWLKVKRVRLSWEQEPIRTILEKAHHDSTEVNLKAVVTLLKELKLIEIKD